MAKHLGVGCGVAAALILLASCGDGRVTNAAPRIETIPAQSTAGGVFSLDLGAFVSDREGGPLVYAVLSGGGAFTGSVYSHTFDTVGSYDVQFSVVDPLGKSAAGSFDVTVTSANLAVVVEGDDLKLLDTDTEKFVTVTGATGFVDTVKATLPRGHLIYERTAGSVRLFAFDPSSRSTFTLGDSADHDTRYAITTPTSLVVFTRTPVASPADSDLFVWNPLNGVVATISAQPGAAEGNPMAASTGLIYYEGAASPSDIWVFDPATSASTLVAGGATAESLRAVLPDDSVVFSRVGTGGEQDLFHYNPSVGEVEVGVDVPAIAALSKVYRGHTSTGVVVFETHASSIDLYAWDPSLGATTAIATSAAHDETVKAVTAVDEVIFAIDTLVPSNVDLSAYLHGAVTPVRVISSAAGDDVFHGSLANGNVVFSRDSSALLFDTVAGSVATLSSAGPFTFHAILGNGNVVMSSGADLYLLETGPIVANAFPSMSFEGITRGGDFVAQSAGGLRLWDEAASAFTVISTNPADEFGAGTEAGDVLFSSKPAGKTTTDLFQWEAATTTTTQLTDGTVDHSVAATYQANT